MKHTVCKCSGPKRVFWRLTATLGGAQSLRLGDLFSGKCLNGYLSSTERRPLGFFFYSNGWLGDWRRQGASRPFASKLRSRIWQEARRQVTSLSGAGIGQRLSGRLQGYHVMFWEKKYMALCMMNHGKSIFSIYPLSSACLRSSRGGTRLSRIFQTTLSRATFSSSSWGQGIPSPDRM